MLGEGTTALTYYQAQVKTHADYYPFGMEMEGRTASSLNYRYGFNGKEKDQAGEFSASQTHYDYGFRIYNPVWGKFLSVDPLTASYSMLTPYQFASNTPIQGVDLDGLEVRHYLRVKTNNWDPLTGAITTDVKLEYLYTTHHGHHVYKGWTGLLPDFEFEEFKGVEVHQTDKYNRYHILQGGQVKFEYDESVTRKSLEDAEKLTDIDFVGTAADKQVAKDVEEADRWRIAGAKYAQSRMSRPIKRPVTPKPSAAPVAPKPVATTLQLQVSSGTGKAKGTGTPNSVYTYLSSDGKAVSNYIYDAQGKVVFQVDFGKHGTVSGHGHRMTTPGNLASGHTTENHVPYSNVPKEYLNIPKDVQYSVPPGQ
jgi:RHS repeat-associated protein